MAIYGLSQTQAKQLLHKHLTGDFLSGHNRELTVKELIRQGMITVSRDCKHLIVTNKGKQWCDAHHLAII